MTQLKPKSKKRSTVLAPKAFTLRDLSRSTAEVIASCIENGSVRIEARDGKRFVLTEEKPTQPALAMPDWEARREKMRALGMVPLTKAQTLRLNKLIAGEYPEDMTA